MSDVAGPVDYAKIKAKLEEVWQSGSAGREALKEALREEIAETLRAILLKYLREKIPDLVINLSSLDAGATTDPVYKQFPHENRMLITVRITYGGGATAGIRVHVKFSADGSNYDTDGLTFDPPFTAGATVQVSELFDIEAARWVSIEVENLDGDVAHSDLMVWVTAK